MPTSITVPLRPTARTEAATVSGRATQSKARSKSGGSASTSAGGRAVRPSAAITSRRSACGSETTTSAPRRWAARAAPSPITPPPTTSTLAPAVDAGQAEGVLADDQRLDQRRQLERGAGRERGGVGGADDHPLGEAAGRVGIAAVDAALRAEVRFAGPAEVAFEAAGDRIDRDRLAELQPLDAGAHLVDDPGRLVAHHQGVAGTEEFVAAFVAQHVAVEVGAADPDRVDLQAHLAGAGVRRLDLLDAEPALAVVEQGAHREHLRGGPGGAELAYAPIPRRAGAPRVRADELPARRPAALSRAGGSDPPAAGPPRRGGGGAGGRRAARPARRLQRPAAGAERARAGGRGRCPPGARPAGPDLRQRPQPHGRNGGAAGRGERHRAGGGPRAARGSPRRVGPPVPAQYGEPRPAGRAGPDRAALGRDPRRRAGGGLHRPGGGRDRARASRRPARTPPRRCSSTAA